MSRCPKHCWESKKIILEKKVNALVVGPFRSEALLAAMDIIAKHKVPMLGTIAMSPKSEAKLMENPEKYKYIFRTCLNGKYLVGYLIGGMKFLNQEFGFNKVFVMNQDVAWARGVAMLMITRFFEKAGWTVLGQETYPTGVFGFLGRSHESESNRSPGYFEHFRHATKRHPGKTVEKHEGPGPHVRVHISAGRSRRLEDLRRSDRRGREFHL